MKKSDIKLIMNYLHRFFEGPIISRQKVVAFGRYIASGFSYFWEKLNGFDYTMVYYTKDASIHNSVYTKTPKKILKRIFQNVQEFEGKGFIDVGCGKGYVVTIANEYPFERVGGVEYTTVLYNTCINNLRKKGLSTKCIYNCDAKEFEKFGDFDIFFFNNPFDETIMEPVAKRIYESHIGSKCYLYYLNPHLKPRTDAIEKAGFKLVRCIPDKNEWYFNINVYEN